MSDEREPGKLYLLPTPEPQSVDAWRFDAAHDPLCDLAAAHAQIMSCVPRRHRRRVTDLLRAYAQAYDECASLTTRWEDE